MHTMSSSLSSWWLWVAFWLGCYKIELVKKMSEKHWKAYNTDGWLKQHYSPCRTESVLKWTNPEITQNAGVEVVVSIFSIFLCSGHG